MIPGNKSTKSPKWACERIIIEIVLCAHSYTSIQNIISYYRASENAIGAQKYCSV